MNYKINKFLTIGLLIFSVQYAYSSEEESIFLSKKTKFNSFDNETNNLSQDKSKDKKIIDKKDVFDKIRKEFPNMKRSGRSDILTLSNNNCKCWFMSTFQLFVTALNQSEPNDLIRRTNFAKFVNHLHNMQNDFVRAINTKENNNVNLDKKTKLKLKTEELNEELNKKFGEKFYKQIQGITDYEWKYRNVMRDRTGKSNVIGGRIDLISELILWCSKNGNWYNVIENNNNTIESKNNINDITKREEERRIKTVKLLESLQDINSDGQTIYCVMIILNLFPELKKLFGSFRDSKENTGDVILDASDKFILDINEIKKANRKDIRFISKEKLRIPKLSSYTPNVDFLNDANLAIHGTLLTYEEDKLKEINKEKEYIILPYSISGCRKSIEIESKNEKYDLIGIQLLNKGHGVCFVKTGKSESSWSGIDSNRNANDDGYKLEDIIDDSNSKSDDNYERLDIINKNLRNKNNYLAKIYSTKDNKDGQYDIGIGLNLYKKRSS